MKEIKNKDLWSCSVHVKNKHKRRSITLIRTDRVKGDEKTGHIT